MMLEDYVLVQEDHTEDQNASEVGKPFVISDISEEGGLKMASAEAINQGDFLDVYYPLPHRSTSPLLYVLTEYPPPRRSKG